MQKHTMVQLTGIGNNSVIINKLDITSIEEIAYTAEPTSVIFMRNGRTYTISMGYAELFSLIYKEDL